MKSPRDVLRRNDELEKRLAKMSPMERDLYTYGRRNRHLIRAFGFVLIILAVYGAALGVGFFFIARNSRSICAAGEANEKLWRPVIERSKAHPPPGETPEQRRERERTTREFERNLASLRSSC